MLVQNKFFSIERDASGVATLIWQMAQPVNVFTQGSLESFAVAIRTLIADTSIKAVVITSGHPIFHVGADLEMASRFAELPADDLFARIMQMHGLFRAMETSGKAFVAAINGHALGGGLEMALACHARFVADAPGCNSVCPRSSLG
jgi:3-hydroxyacyl-CoA dehydrogenase / enoyl-CoA hydratase / 3-hydroxybutyryl-CoA epimerase